jgi:acyl transferase domain-containing protein
VSINSFGYGGTNAHIIMDEVQAYLSSQQANGYQMPRPLAESLSLDSNTFKRVFVFAANDEDVGKRMMADVSQYLKSRRDWDAQSLMNDLAFTLAQRRSMLLLKAAITASSLPQLIENLDAGNIKFVRSSRVAKIGFVFTGQGAQWAGMGRELFGVYEVFDKTLHRAEQHLQRLGASWLLTGQSYALQPNLDTFPNRL